MDPAIYLLGLWTLGCISFGYYLRGQSNYRKYMESEGVPVEAPKKEEQTVADERIPLDREV